MKDFSDEELAILDRAIQRISKDSEPEQPRTPRGSSYWRTIQINDEVPSNQIISIPTPPRPDPIQYGVLEHPIQQEQQLSLNPEHILIQRRNELQQQLRRANLSLQTERAERLHVELRHLNEQITEMERNSAALRRYTTTPPPQTTSVVEELRSQIRETEINIGRLIPTNANFYTEISRNVDLHMRLMEHRGERLTSRLSFLEDKLRYLDRFRGAGDSEVEFMYAELRNKIGAYMNVLRDSRTSREREHRLERLIGQVTLPNGWRQYTPTFLRQENPFATEEVEERISIENESEEEDGS